MSIFCGFAELFETRLMGSFWDLVYKREPIATKVLNICCRRTFYAESCAKIRPL